MRVKPFAIRVRPKMVSLYTKKKIKSEIYGIVSCLLQMKRNVFCPAMSFLCSDCV